MKKKQKKSHWMWNGETLTLCGRTPMPYRHAHILPAVKELWQVRYNRYMASYDNWMCKTCLKVLGAEL